MTAGNGASVFKQQFRVYRSEIASLAEPVDRQTHVHRTCQSLGEWLYRVIQWQDE